MEPRVNKKRSVDRIPIFPNRLVAMSLGVKHAVTFPKAMK